VDRAAIGVDLVTEHWANRKLSKYAQLASDYILQPIAVENLGSFRFIYRQAFYLISVAKSSGEDKETSFSFLFQRISVLIQRFNSVLLHDSFTKDGQDQAFQIVAGWQHMWTWTYVDYECQS